MEEEPPLEGITKKVPVGWPELCAMSTSASLLVAASFGLWNRSAVIAHALVALRESTGRDPFLVDVFFPPSFHAAHALAIWEESPDKVCVCEREEKGPLLALMQVYAEGRGIGTTLAYWSLAFLALEEIVSGVEKKSDAPPITRVTCNFTPSLGEQHHGEYYFSPGDRLLFQAAPVPEDSCTERDLPRGETRIRVEVFLEKRCACTWPFLRCEVVCAPSAETP